MKKTPHLLRQASINGLIFCILMLLNSPVFSIPSNTSTNLTTTSANTDYQKAYRYEKNKNLKNAIKWYKKAAKKSHAKAQYRLGILYYREKNYKKAKYWLNIRAKAGEADAQYHYANILRFGLGVKQQTSLARKWYQKAAKQGHKQAQYELGIMFKKGIGAQVNLKKAKKWLAKAAKQNHKQAKYALKSLTTTKKTTPHKTQKRITQKQFLKKTTKLANAGNTQAQYELGKAYKTGKNAPNNPKQAFKWLNKAAKGNHADAQYLLAKIYAEGNRVTAKNPAKAKFWYDKAADNEHKKAAKALSKIAKLEQKKQQIQLFDNMINSALLGKAEQQYALGMHYLLGFKTDPDARQAYYWFSLAAEKNHPRAMYQLGNQYLQGNGVEKDTNKAIHYLASAARQKIKPAQTAVQLFANNGYKTQINAENGDKVAQLKLAKSYLAKTSVSQKRTGLKWLQKAAGQKYPPALFELAKIHEHGDIVPKDLEKAFNIYKTAAAQNNPKAQYKIGQMYLTGTGTRRNQKLAYRWFEMAASQGLREAEQALQFSGL